MKNKIFILTILLFGAYILNGQPVNLLLNSSESGTKLHEARKSILFDVGYEYTIGSGTMTANIADHTVDGSTSYQQNQFDTTRTINTSYMVGTTKGAFNVNHLGAATYMIPLDLPPGINGLQPNLSLVYSSMGGQGFAGLGWQLAGISAITRTPQTVFQDGQTKGINLDSNDRFALDGLRLVCTSGTYGNNNSQYRTENDIFTRVTEYTAQGQSEKFIAETKSGHLFKYGYTDESVQKIGSYTQGLSWCVSSASDLFGNKINYYYTTQSSHVYPSSIEYGPNSVVFYYKERSDTITSYFKGEVLQEKLLLDKVEIRYKDNLIKTYQLKYGQISQRIYNSNTLTQSILEEVTEYGTGTNRLNSTVFAYHQPEVLDLVHAGEINNTYLNNTCIPYSGDFNGDGRDEIFSVKADSTNKWSLFADTLQTGFTRINHDNWNIHINQAIPSDLNGDGKADLILISFTLGGTITTYYYAISTGNSFQTPVQITSFLTATNYQDRKYRYVADFDGDGFPDCIVKKYSWNDNRWWVYSMFDTSLQSDMVLKYGGTNGGTISNWGDKNYVGDFNGDGKADIWVFDANGLKIYTVDGNSLTQIYSPSYPTSDNKFILGDFNGDGKTDLFVYGTSTSYWAQWYFYLSTGTGFTIKQFSRKKGDLEHDNVFPADFNGDGRTDIIALSLYNDLPDDYFMMANVNCTDLVYDRTDPLNFPMHKDHGYIYGDYNGDGKSDAVGLPNDSQYYIFRPSGETNMMMNYTGDGLGNKVTIKYKRLSEKDSPYEKGHSANVCPVFTWQGPLAVVDTVHYNSGEATENSTYYRYKGLKIHRQGKAFLSYEKTTVTDTNTGISTDNCYGYNSTYFVPTLDTTIVRYNSSKMSVTNNITSYKSLGTGYGNKRYFPNNIYSEEHNVLTGQDRITTHSYDDWGNLTYSLENYEEGEAETKDTIENITDSGKWLLGRVLNSTTKYTRSGCSDVTKRVNRTYASTSNLLLTETLFPSTTSELLKFYEYYPYGSLKKDSISDGSVSRVTKYEYGTDSIRVKKITDPLGHDLNKAYNEYGWFESETDYLNNTISYTYDDFGRQVEQTNADGSALTSGLHWYSSGEPANALYYLEKSGNDGALSKTWYDKLAREIRTDAKGFDGSMISVLKSYNAKGQLYSVSEPYSSTGSPSQYTTYTYDNYGRADTISRYTGSITSYTYDDNVVTENTDGHEYTKTYNSDGTLAEATDPGGTLTYTYYPDGKTKTITAPGSVVTTLEYEDAARNQTKLIDPSAGTINYTYDKFGQLKTQTDAQSNVTTTNYHPDGRINTIVSPEGTTTYRYNTNKQLTGISSPNSVSRAFEYDSHGRINTVRDTIAGSNYLTTFTFDTLGRQKTITHPSGIMESISYNSSGYIDSISAGGITRHTITGMNVRGQVTSATYGTNLNATYGYDTYGYPSSIQTGSVLDYRYSFDATTGNLSSRQNYLRSKSESFTYDDLYRLTAVTGPQNLTMTYNDNGNILTKSDIGTTDFSYGNSAGPYALTGLSSSTLVIPTDSQAVSYNSLKKISSITEGKYMASFIYNSDNERAKMEVTRNDTTILTRRYINGSYMEETAGGATTKYTFIGGDAYTAPVVAVTLGGTTNYYYILRDHIGNITHQVNTANTVVVEYSYDAWGRRRNHSDWSYNLTGQPELFAGRGFTGHEHLQWFNLINMNGRLYDPVVGRFLSPDLLIQAPDITQNFNRYSYCLNNPLKYSDASGDFFWLPVFIGVAMGGFMNGVQTEMNGGNFWDGAWRGAIVGAIGGALSNFGGGTFLNNVLWGTGEGAITGGISAALNGGDIGNGILNGAAIGGAFAFGQSTIESLNNYNDYGKFGTNDGVFNRMTDDAFIGNPSTGTYTIDPEKAQKALNFWQDRNGGPSLSFASGQSNGNTDVYGNIKIGEGAFVGGHSAVREQISHEMGHYMNNVNWDNGKIGGTVSDEIKNVNWDNGKLEGSVSKPHFINTTSQYGGDGVYGYNGAIESAGRYHTSFKMISNGTYYRPNTLWYITNPYRSTAWQTYSWEKWFYLIPRRF